MEQRAFHDSPVLIAGAGVGGLTLALALAKYGIASHVFERRQSFDEDGAGIQIGPNGSRILIGLGLDTALLDCVSVPDAIHIRDGKRGASIARLPVGSYLAARHRAPYWTVHRTDLHAALLARARHEPLVTLSMRTTVKHAVSHTMEVAMTLTDGQVYRGDVFVAADGFWSSLRRAFIDAPVLRRVGKSAVRSVVSFDAVPKPLQHQETGLWLTTDAHVVHYPVRRGRAVAMVAVFDDASTSGGWGTNADIGWIAERSRILSPLLQQLLEVPGQWRKWTLFSAPPFPSLASGRCALLGDAAHPMLPFLAQGGVMAIEDAAVLANCLALMPESPEAALNRYEHARLARTRRVIRASARNGRIYHLDGFGAQVRDGVLRWLKPEAVMARYDWLYGWCCD